MTGILENTGEWYCEDICDTCKSFNEIDGVNTDIGICDCCLSHHYKHVLVDDHSACDQHTE